MSVQELLDFRQRKDGVFASIQSPLTLPLRNSFQGLNYFDFDASYIFQMRLQNAREFEHIMMKTSSGLSKSYVRAGWLEFVVAAQSVRLTAFSNPEIEGSELFIPFKDASNGTLTYGGGRYLNLVPDDDEIVLLDFNLAYNPYCAYSEAWTCPIPPLENHLRVSILAGEKVYGETK